MDDQSTAWRSRRSWYRPNLPHADHFYVLRIVALDHHQKLTWWKLDRAIADGDHAATVCGSADNNEGGRILDSGTEREAPRNRHDGCGIFYFDGPFPRLRF